MDELTIDELYTSTVKARDELIEAGVIKGLRSREDASPALALSYMAIRSMSSLDATDKEEEGLYAELVAAVIGYGYFRGFDTLTALRETVRRLQVAQEAAIVFRETEGAAAAAINKAAATNRE